MSNISEKITKRRRGASLERALLDGAWEELKEVGYKNLTFDGVANRAGTSKAVLYRRWHNRLELVRAVMRARHLFLSDPIPNTGNLRDDVLSLLTHMTSGLRELPPDFLWGLMTDAIDNPEHDVFVLQVRGINAKVMTDILKHAEDRGEITVAALPEKVLTVPVDLARHEMFMTGRPLTKTAITQIVDDVFLPLVLSD